MFPAQGNSWEPQGHFEDFDERGRKLKEDKCRYKMQGEEKKIRNKGGKQIGTVSSELDNGMEKKV